MQLQLAGQYLTLELLVFAHVRGVNALHLMCLQQWTHAEVVHAGVVADNGQLLGAGSEQRADQVLRNTAQAKTAGGDGHAINQ